MRSTQPHMKLTLNFIAGSSCNEFAAVTLEANYTNVDIPYFKHCLYAAYSNKTFIRT
jgi:hypothetical protein